MQARFGPHEMEDPDAEGEQAEAAEGSGDKLLNSISSAFDSYMGIYVALEVTAY